MEMASIPNMPSRFITKTKLRVEDMSIDFLMPVLLRTVAALPSKERNQT